MPDPITDEELIEVLAYCEAATEGPWEVEDGDHDCYFIRACEGDFLIGGIHKWLVDAAVEGEANARLTARSRTDLPRIAKGLQASRAEIDRVKNALFETNDEVEQALGKALGYPWFKDDKKNFPDATEEDGVCIGEHVTTTIADEAAECIDTLKAKEARDEREAIKALEEIERYEEFVEDTARELGITVEWSNHYGLVELAEEQADAIYILKACIDALSAAYAREERLEKALEDESRDAREVFEKLQHTSKQRDGEREKYQMADMAVQGLADENKTLQARVEELEADAIYVLKACIHALSAAYADEEAARAEKAEATLNDTRVAGKGLMQKIVNLEAQRDAAREVVRQFVELLEADRITHKEPVSRRAQHMWDKAEKQGKAVLPND